MKISTKPKAKKAPAGKQATKKPAKKSPVRKVIGKTQGHPLARVLSHAAQLLHDGLPKGLAVAAAVSAELTSNGKWPPNDLNRTMDSYHYNVNSLDNFLVDVQQSLQPSYVFTFDAGFVAASLPLTVAALTGSIDDNTVEAP
jgi:hypothetical protein